MRVGNLAITAATVALFLNLGVAESAEPLKIRLAWVFVPSSLGPILFSKQDIPKHLGTSYVVETVHFVGTAPEIVALATGDIDISDLSFAAFGSAIENAHMDYLRVFADGVEDGVHGYDNNEFMVLKDGPIQSIEDLKGKVLAANAVGGAMDMGMRAMLRRHHLEDKRDYSVIEVEFPSMKAILSQHKADLVSAVPPYSLDPELRDKSRTLFTLKDSFGPVQLTSWVARGEFLQKNRATMVDFMEDVLRSVRWYMDPANHKEAVAIAASFMKQPPERVDWAFTKKDNYRDPNGLPNLDALQSNLNTQRDLGFLKTNIDVRKYADSSIVEEAARRLK